VPYFSQFQKRAFILAKIPLTIASCRHSSVGEVWVASYESRHNLNNSFVSAHN